jgi:hypothetical protein
MQAQINKDQNLAQFALMATPLSSNKPLSPEERVELYQQSDCSKCGAIPSSGQRFMVCGDCEGPSYCS